MVGERDDARAASPRPTLFDEARVYPDLASIRFIARAITPPGRPRRFDARFFAAEAEAIAHRVDGVVGPDAELVELVWLPIGEVERPGVAGHHQGGAEGARGAHRRRLRPRPAGPVLPHAARTLHARGAVTPLLDELRLSGALITLPAAVRFRPNHFARSSMAKAASIKIKLVSSADTGFYYVAKKNSRTMTDKLVKKKYDPVAKKHVEFREAKIK